MDAYTTMSGRESLVGPGAGWQAAVSALAVLAAAVHATGDRPGAEEIVRTIYAVADLGAAGLHEPPPALAA